jgi:hypothetical protein
MYIDFLDIGTSDFDIGNGYIEGNKTYLLVEPLQHFLNNIPNTSNVLKANYAISNVEGIVDVFYIEEKDIKEFNLPFWIKGCNKINEKHPTAVKFLQQHNIPESIIKHKKVKCINFQTLCQIYNLRHIDSLKIDTEGHDHIILQEVITYLLLGKIVINRIKLEYVSVFGNTSQIDLLREQIKHLYPIQEILGENIVLSKK